MARLPGVAAAQPMQHRFAYVGNDLQDLYGIDPATIGQATTDVERVLRRGRRGRDPVHARGHPDGVLVSEETVHDFQLTLGDTVSLRLQFAADQRYHVVPVHLRRRRARVPDRAAGLVHRRERRLRGAGDGTRDAAQTLLVRTDGSPPAVAGEIRTVLGPTSGATVQDIVTQQRVTLSSLTAIDLAGLTRLELAFALAAGGGLPRAWCSRSGSAERRRTFAIATALGARRAAARGVRVERGDLRDGGRRRCSGRCAGWGIALVIVKILTGVFDPPPEHLAVPWTYLAAVARGGGAGRWRLRARACGATRPGHP